MRSAKARAEHTDSRRGWGPLRRGSALARIRTARHGRHKRNMISRRNDRAAVADHQAHGSSSGSNTSVVAGRRAAA
jgi:hypothetical protein